MARAVHAIQIDDQELELEQHDIAAVKRSQHRSRQIRQQAIERRRRNFARFTLGLAIFVVALLVGRYLWSLRSATVPALVGRSLEMAEAQASEAGVGLKIAAGRYDKSLPAGTILRQKPKPGVSLRSGDRMVVVVSRGPRPVGVRTAIVPLLEGLNLHQAKLMLARAHLKYSLGGTAATRLRGNQKVVIQIPAAGAIVKPGKVVTLMSGADLKALRANPYPVQFDPVKPEVIQRGNPDRKEVALTLDDGWNADPRILDYLEQNGIRGTAFLIGGRGVANANPELVARLDKMGWEVANHTYTHYIMTAFDDEWVGHDLRKAQKVISNITRKQVPYVRPPGGAYGDRFVNVAAANGFKVVMWTIDSADSRSATYDQEVANVLNNLQPGAVILFHFGGHNTYEVLQRVIPEIRQRGYKITTVTDVLR